MVIGGGFDDDDDDDDDMIFELGRKLLRCACVAATRRGAAVVVLSAVNPHVKSDRSEMASSADLVRQSCPGGYARRVVRGGSQQSLQAAGEAGARAASSCGERGKS